MRIKVNMINIMVFKENTSSMLQFGRNYTTRRAMNITIITKQETLPTMFRQN